MSGVSPETEAWAAARIVAMHQDGRCAQRHRDGCRLLTWARVILRKWEEGGRPVPAATVPVTALTYRQSS